VDELNINYICNDRSILVNPYTNTPLELDIYLPSLSKAIECNGDYWHSSEDRKKIDIIKKQLCYNLGIDLFVLMYSEWDENRSKCKELLIQFLYNNN
jgi:hypothetical protein